MRHNEKSAGPNFDTKTHYRIEVRGRLDVEWLKSLDNLAEICVDESRQMEATTVLEAHADQSGIVGLVRGLHGMGITIEKIYIIP
jgi:hypothetical protein